MVNLEGNMTNSQNSETQVTIGYSRTITRTKHGNWHGYQRRDGKILYLTLSNTAVILVLNTKSKEFPSDVRR